MLPTCMHTLLKRFAANVARAQNRVSALASLYIIALACSVAIPLPLHAQEDATQLRAPTEQKEHSPKNSIERRLTALRTLVDKIVEQQNNAAALQEKLSQTQNGQEITKLTEEIQQTQTQLNENYDSFMQLLSGTSLRIYSQLPSQETKTFTDELKSLFQPILSKLEDLTEKSRKIEQLRRDIAGIKDLEQRITSGLEQTLSLKKQTQDKRLLEAFNIAINNIQNRLEELKRDRLIKEEYFNKLSLSDKGSWHNFQQFFSEVLTFHIKNFILMLFSIFGSNFVLLYLYGWVLKRPRVQRFITEVPWARMLDVLARLAIFVLAFVVGLSVLYSLNDWVVITLIALLAVGLLWSLKDRLPTMLQNIQLLLNVGTVRERERVIFNGLPWEVKPITYFTRLINPALEGGQLRVPLSVLGKLSSRPFSRNDQWFPTRKFDWVLLADGTYGQVILQTPDHVVLQIMGASEKTYFTKAFLDNTPTNLSRGYGLYLKFGVDYCHQQEVTQEIPLTLKDELLEGFIQYQQNESMVDIVVEFADASSSSLNIAIFAKFKAEAADRYFVMRRLLLRLLVESCTRHDWKIPFTQITVHAAQGNENPEMER